MVTTTPAGKSGLYLSPALERGQAGRSLKAAAAAAADISASWATERRLIPVAGSKSASRAPATLVTDLYYRPASRATRALAALLSGVAVLLAGLAVAVWLAGRWMVAPLARLSAQVDKVAGGELTIAVPRSRIGEIANIAQAVEGMTAALGETAQRRAEADEARRFLVTSVAHDLRTPLFALRGHLQAIGSRLGNPAVHLERAEARADALERLIGNLFAYTRDDYAQPAPQLEAVPVADLLAGGRGRPRAHEPPPGQHVRSRRRPGARRRRRPRPVQTRAHQHPRQRTPLQPSGRSDPPPLGRPGRVDRPDHRPRPRTRNRPRPPPAHLRTRHPRNPGRPAAPTTGPGSASRSPNASSSTSTPPSRSTTSQPGAHGSASLSNERHPPTRPEARPTSSARSARSSE